MTPEVAKYLQELVSSDLNKARTESAHAAFHFSVHPGYNSWPARVAFLEKVNEDLRAVQNPIRSRTLRWGKGRK